MDLERLFMDMGVTCILEGKAFQCVKVVSSFL